MTRPVKIKNTVIGEGMPKVCVPLVSASLADLEAEAQKALECFPNLVEWRADFFDEINDMGKLLRALEKLSGILDPVPMIFTIRTSLEGGSLQISTKDYVNVLMAVAKTGYTDIIDVEVFRDEEMKKKLIRCLKTMGVKVIGSSHNFQSTPPMEEMLESMKKIDESGADMIKLAVMPQSLADVGELLETTKEFSSKRTEKPVITMSMGEIGRSSRFSGELYGSAVTFGTAGQASAPGQMAVDELRDMMMMLHSIQFEDHDHHEN